MEVGLVWNANWEVRASKHESVNCLQFTSTATGAGKGDRTPMLPGYMARLPTLQITQKRSEMAPDRQMNGSSQVQSMISHASLNSTASYPLLLSDANYQRRGTAR